VAAWLRFLKLVTMFNVLCAKDLGTSGAQN